MSAKFTPLIRSFVASSLIDNITLQQLPEWTQTTPYLEGDVVFYGNNKYVAKGAGTSGTIAPVHVSGTASDGVLDWIWIEAININQMFKRNVFVAIGRRADWDDEQAPPTAGITDADHPITFSQFTTLKRVSSGNFRLAVKRYNWTSGSVYDAYDSTKDPLAVSGDPLAYTNPFYVFTDDLNLYKCLDNNAGGQSTIMPTATSTTPFTTADDYVWKFMATLDADAVYFLTADYVPVRYKLTDDGTQQWDVQQAAVAGSLSGVKILANTDTNGDFPGTPVVTLTGGSPGTPAVGYAVMDVDDKLVQVLLSNYGAGYDASERVDVVVRAQAAATPGSEAVVDSITIDGSGTITGLTASPAGSGYTSGAILLLVDPTNTPTTVADIDVVLGGSNEVTGFTINDGGAGYSDDVRGYIISGTSGAVGIGVLAPKEGHGYNIVTELAANTAIIQVRLSEESDYLLVDDGNEFRQVALVTDVVDKTTLEPAYNTIYIGPDHPNWGNATENEIDDVTGHILYLNNITPVERSIGQEEDLKIAITF